MNDAKKNVKPISFEAADGKKCVVANYAMMFLATRTEKFGPTQPKWPFGPLLF